MFLHQNYIRDKCKMVDLDMHSLVKSAGTITSEWRPKFPILFVNKILSLLFRPKWALSRYQMTINNAEFFALSALLAIIYGVYSVIRHQTSMAKSREIGECERAAIFHLRVAGHSFAEIAQKSRLHEVKSIQNYAKA